jgi:hypothetical protein
MASISVAGDSSGSITIAAPAVAGSGTLTLPVATDTLVGKATTDTLTNKSIAATQLTGTIAAAALPAGSVLQVVNATYGTQVSNSTVTYADTGLTATITPTKNTSKILVLVNQTAVSRNTGNNSSQLYIKLLRDSLDISVFLKAWSYNGLSAYFPSAAASICYLDSPATTSATIYKTQFQNGSNAAMVTVQEQNSISTITLMEIAG